MGRRETNASSEFDISFRSSFVHVGTAVPTASPYAFTCGAAVAFYLQWLVAKTEVPTATAFLTRHSGDSGIPVFLFLLICHRLFPGGSKGVL